MVPPVRDALRQAYQHSTAAARDAEAPAGTPVADRPGRRPPGSSGGQDRRAVGVVGRSGSSGGPGGDSRGHPM
ncbi:hypothetical protein FRAAL0395 [Frankia alni ACN14a]|uniref:Uncharacterized protein n=1 Tax=Frankia alni (strain DSM 45986 / CECT 9034 / ACN14a) TaxID=326424 RepID=Q0RTM8_FRAAA|nr:hypothetical protein FRAAL0395 [Frankia alni ACN14a]